MHIVAFAKIPLLFDKQDNEISFLFLKYQK